jgi:hypothetical protein
MEIRTCTFIHDDGNLCNSAAVTDRNLCLYHLSHRVRLMRMAQYRARAQRFDLQLPPLESMPSVMSALNQVVEAVAADMLDLKRADFLLKSLRFAAQALKNSDKWPASITHSTQPAPAIDIAATYGLPSDLDLNLRPELAFPSPAMGGPQLPDVGNCGGTPSLTGNWLPATGNFPPMPTVDYCDHGPGCPQHTIRIDYPETPELAELREIKETQGMDAAVERYKQQQRNIRRREVKVGRKRYAAIALEKNMRLAAERLAERKLAERKLAEMQIELELGCPAPASVAGAVPDTAKKPAASVTSDTVAPKKEAKSIA